MAGITGEGEEVAVEGAKGPRLITPLFLRVVLVNFVFFVGVGGLVPAVPRFVEGPLGAGPVAVGLVVGMYAFGALIAGPLAGRLSDRRGRRQMIAAGALVAAGATAAYTLVTEVWMLAALRFLGGAGEATLFVGTATIINDLAPETRRGEAISLFSLTLNAGISVGPLLGELLVEGPGFNTTWLVVASVPILTVLLALGCRTHAPSGRRVRTDGSCTLRRWSRHWRWRRACGGSAASRRSCPCTRSRWASTGPGTCS